MNLNNAMNMLSCGVSGQNINYCSTDLNGQAQNANYVTASTGGIGGTNTLYQWTDNNPTLWNYWQNWYYPQVIRESYPVYIQEKAMDKGKQAFELVKALMDKKLLNVDKVKDFVEAMDTVLKTL